MEIYGYISAAVYGALCLLLSYIVNRLGMKREYTRKLVHIAIGFEWVILYLFFGAGWHSFIICAAFTALLVVAYFKKLMPMISSDGDNSAGTVYYGLSMTLMSLLCVFLPEAMLPFGVGVVCTSLGDGFAGVVGLAVRRYNFELLGKKTALGTLACFMLSFIGSLLFSVLFRFDITLTDCLAIAALSAVLELLTVRGFDNISVPLGTGILAYALAYAPIIDAYLIPIILTPLLVMAVIKARVLSIGGVIAALVLDVCVSFAFGGAGFLILLSFLILSVIADKFKVRRKTDEKKARDEIQVLANGGVALVCALAYIFAPKAVFICAFVAVLAEALADTVSSGVGALAKRTFDLFRFKECEAGVSGGVSLVGTLAALFASFVLPLLAFALGLIEPIYILICGAFAFVGCFIDTLIGALLQEKYLCKRCGALTDGKIHCKASTVKHSGLSFVDNNVTNFISNALVAIALILVG